MHPLLKKILDPPLELDRDEVELDLSSVVPSSAPRFASCKLGFSTVKSFWLLSVVQISVKVCEYFTKVDVAAR